MTKPRLLLAALAIAAVALPALANDSSAELAAGGLVLTKDANIEMRSEDLYISPKAVRVTYRFRNTSAAPVTTLVAFPMPDIDIEGVDDIISIPTEDPENILGFSTKVDGKKVAAKVEQRAISLKDGSDQTALLKSLGVPLAPHLEKTREAVDHLPPAAQKKLIDLDLAVVDEFDAGKGWEKHVAPRWKLKTTYYWSQTFPAGRDVVVEHRYTPSVGATAGTSVGTEYFDAEERARYVSRYCIDAGFLKAATKAVGADEHVSPYFEKRIDYILKTGGNWKKPIGSFRMVIDKEHASSLVSFCATGVKKIGPTQFEVRKTNWRPDRDLSILLLVRSSD